MDVIYQIYIYLSYTNFKNLGLLNKSLYKYSKRNEYKKLLIKKYVNILMSYRFIKSFPDNIRSINYHIRNRNVEVVSEITSQMTQFTEIEKSRYSFNSFLIKEYRNF